MQFLTEANQSCERMWKTFFWLVKGGCVNIIFSAIFSAVISQWQFGQYVSEYTFHAYKARYVHMNDV